MNYSKLAISKLKLPGVLNASMTAANMLYIAANSYGISVVIFPEHKGEPNK